MLTRAIIVCAAIVLNSGLAWAQMPLSAIDWLSETLTNPSVRTEPAEPQADRTPFDTPGSESISVAPITAVTSDSVGLLPTSATGLPNGLWGTTDSSEIAVLLSEAGHRQLPSMQRLLFVLLLAEVETPADGDTDGRLFLARIDSLLDLGAVEQAQALLERAGPNHPERFRRWFDVSLLTGTERAACASLLRSPELLKSLSVRIFCLARKGDWNTASLTLDVGRALGVIDEVDSALLIRFLNPELDDVREPLPARMRPSPLEFRIHEAIGEPLPTTTLPRAFAQADLRSNVGWKAQIEAAERLAQSGAVSANLLLGLYTKKRPAASGGVWDRAAAIQGLDVAIREEDPDGISESLPEAWHAMQQLGLEAFLAELYADSLRDIELTKPASSIAYRLMLLSKEYESASENHAPENEVEGFMQAVSKGDPRGVQPPTDVARAIADGFREANVPEHLARMIKSGNIGAAILLAVRKMREGEMGDLGGLTEAIALFRAIGLEEVARRAALETMILDRRA